MKFVLKEKGSKARIIKIRLVITAGYRPITTAYKPHIKPCKTYAITDFGHPALSDIRIMPEEIEVKYEKLTTRIQQLQQELQELLDDNFLTFPLIKIEDFDPAMVRQGLTKEEARKRLPHTKKKGDEKWATS